MLDVRRLRLLRELALRGTIAAVADALAFTPSAVSQQLSALEREAGARLLERTGRRVTLTSAGQRLVAHTEEILERLERAEAELAETGRDIDGPVRIGTPPSATSAILLPALDSLARSHPGLEPAVTEIDPADAADALRAGGLDVALVHEYDLVPPLKEPGLASAPLYTESMYLAASSSPPQQSGTSPLLAWRDAPWIMSTPGTLCHAMTIRACEAVGFRPRVRHEIDDFTVVLALVAAGHGVALVPYLGMSNAPPRTALTRLPIRRRTKAAYRAGTARHPVVHATLTALRASSSDL